MCIVYRFDENPSQTEEVMFILMSVHATMLHSININILIFRQSS